MKPYTLTPEDIKLIGDFAGALNAGRAHVAPAERFGNIQIPANPNQLSVKWSHADELQELYNRATTEEPVEPPVQAIVVEIPWGAPPTENPAPIVQTQNGWSAPFARTLLPNFQDQAYAYHFVVPEGGPLPVVGYSSVFEHMSPNGPWTRQAVLSRVAGDFANPITPDYQSSGNQATVYWTRGTSHLTPGSYYFNIRNVDASKNYPAMVEFIWPR